MRQQAVLFARMPKGRGNPRVEHLDVFSHPFGAARTERNAHDRWMGFAKLDACRGWRYSMLFAQGKKTLPPFKKPLVLDVRGIESSIVKVGSPGEKSRIEERGVDNGYLLVSQLIHKGKQFGGM